MTVAEYDEIALYDEIARLEKELIEACSILGNLIVYLNGDGGQHLINVGIERAAKDGLAAYHKAIVERDSARHELEKLKGKDRFLSEGFQKLNNVCVSLDADCLGRDLFEWTANKLTEFYGKEATRETEK
jgi:hypothetical protein